MNITENDILIKWQQKLLLSSLPPVALKSTWWTETSKTREFARTAHQNQLRKGTTDPYFIHVAEVAMIIGSFEEQGFLSPAELHLALAAAWLHDTVEDCGITLGTIDELFGTEVKSVVDALTKHPVSFNVTDPMADSLIRIAQSGRVASLVKIADRISNLSWNPPANWQNKQICRYGQEGRRIVAALCSHIPKEAALALESVSDAYMKSFGGLSRPSNLLQRKL